MLLLITLLNIVKFVLPNHEYQKILNQLNSTFYKDFIRMEYSFYLADLNPMGV